MSVSLAAFVLASGRNNNSLGERWLMTHPVNFRSQPLVVPVTVLP
jgi:hypothetical protein